MQETVLSYCSEDKEMHAIYKNNLLERNSGLMLEILKRCDSIDPGFPKGWRSDRMGDTRIDIHFPYDLPDKNKKKYEEGERVAVEDANLRINLDSLARAFAMFTTKAMEVEMKNLEIIPLEGYSIIELKKDIRAAIKAERNFCVVDKMSEYEKFTRGESEGMNQAVYSYLSDTYCDIAIAIDRGTDMKEVAKMVNLSQHQWI